MGPPMATARGAAAALVRTRIMGQAEGYLSSPWHANVLHIGEKMSPIQMVCKLLFG